VDGKKNQGQNLNNLSGNVMRWSQGYRYLGISDLSGVWAATETVLQINQMEILDF
jgi:hypothetical protein